MNARADAERLKLVTANPEEQTAKDAQKGQSKARGATKAPEVKPTPIPRVEVSKGGVFYIGTKVDPQSGATTELPPMWLAEKMEILGRGVDESGEHYRILRWHSRGNGQEQNRAINLGIVGERECWKTLRAGGLPIASVRRALEQLAGWLQTGGEDTMHTVSHRGGWNLGAYVLPSGEIIGEPSSPLFYNGDRSHAPAYQARGTVESWRENVAGLCNGNSRPMLAIGASLAAPLLHLVGGESGGFHLFGPSGCGKTTSANVGASVWGIPRQQVLNWDATALALANAAAARNDGLMLLDEIGQGNPEAVQQAAYRLFNGTGKMQGAREGGNREMLRWRILVLSTGEVDLASFIQGGGRRARAGQEVRLASLSADAGAGMGAFEGLHGMPDPNHLAKALDRAVNEHFGTVGRFFVAHVARDMDAAAKRLQRAISDLLEDLPPEAGGQVRRVAARFAVVGEALEIATDAGITGWEPGDGRHAIRRCFDAWLDRYGLGNREDQQILEQAEEWFEAHAWSRFIDWEDAKDHNREPNVKDCAGYRRRESDELTFLVSKGAFINEIAGGFDKTAAANTLEKSGMLKKGNDGNATTVKKTPDNPISRRFYVFVRTQRVEGTGGLVRPPADLA